jgi:hypothetical protein
MHRVIRVISTQEEQEAYNRELAALDAAYECVRRNQMRPYHHWLQTVLVGVEPDFDKWYGHDQL